MFKYIQSKKKKVMISPCALFMWHLQTHHPEWQVTLVKLWIIYNLSTETRLPLWICCKCNYTKRHWGHSTPLVVKSQPVPSQRLFLAKENVSWTLSKEQSCVVPVNIYLCSVYSPSFIISDFLKPRLQWDLRGLLFYLLCTAL